MRLPGRKRQKSYRILSMYQQTAHSLCGNIDILYIQLVAVVTGCKAQKTSQKE